MYPTSLRRPLEGEFGILALGVAHSGVWSFIPSLRSRRYGRQGPHNTFTPRFLPWPRRTLVTKGPTINSLTGCINSRPHGRRNFLALFLHDDPQSNTMWKLSLFILYATSLFVFVSAGPEDPDFYFPLNTCTLTIQSTTGKVVDPRTIITYGVAIPPRSPTETNV